MHTAIALLISALADAAGERLTRAALAGRTRADVERDLLAVTGLPVATVQRAVRLASVRHVRACRSMGDALAFVAPLYGCACATDAAQVRAKNNRHDVLDGVLRMHILISMNSATTNTVTLTNGRKTISYEVTRGSETATKLWSIVKREMPLAQARREMRQLMAKGYAVTA